MNSNVTKIAYQKFKPPFSWGININAIDKLYVSDSEGRIVTTITSRGFEGHSEAMRIAIMIERTLNECATKAPEPKNE